MQAVRAFAHDHRAGGVARREDTTEVPEYRVPVFNWFGGCLFLIRERSASELHELKLCKNSTHKKSKLHFPSFPGETGPAQPNGDDQQESSKCPQNPYRILGNASDYWDQQNVKLQELPEDVPLGDMPRPMNVVLNRKLCDKLVPGSRCTVLGVAVAIDSEAKTGRLGAGRRIGYLQAVGLLTGQGGNRIGIYWHSGWV